MMIKPILKNEELLNDIQTFSSNNSFKIWWLGQSGFLLKYLGKTILFDPYLSDSLSVKYEKTDKPHNRISEIVIQPSSLSFVNIVTSSHNHTDHLDAETLKPLLKKNDKIKFIIPEANREFVCERLNCELNFPIGINDTSSVVLGEFTIIGIAAAHNEIERDQNGNAKYLGYIVKFGPYSIYHSGDTLWYNGLDKLLEQFNLDIAFLPINGNKPERRVAGNLSAFEAAKLGKIINAKLVIPHHYHLFEFNTEDPQVFENECINQNVDFKTLKLGEGFEYRKI